MEKNAGKNMLVTRLRDFVKYCGEAIVLADYVKVDMRLAQFNLESLVVREESLVRRPRPQDAYSLQA